MDAKQTQEWAARRTHGGGAEVVPQREMPEGDSSDVHVVLAEQAEKIGEVVAALDEMPDPDESVIELRNDAEEIQKRLEAKAKELGAQPEAEQDEDTSSEEITT